MLISRHKAGESLEAISQMPEQDPGTGELHHAQVVRDVSLPAGDYAAAVVEPGKEPFDFPAALRASQRPAVLRLRAASTIRRDHLDAVLRHQQVVESIAVIAAVADQAPREVGKEARVEGGGDEVWLIR